MAFFTSVYQFKNNLLVRGYDDLGEPFSYQSNGNDMDLNLYIPDKNSNSKFKTLSGMNVKPIKFNSIDELIDFKKSFGNDFELHGDFNIANQYINQLKLAENVKIPQIRIGFFDVECSSRSGFPDIIDPIEELLVISCYSSRTKIITGFVVGDYGQSLSIPNVELEVINCQSEKELALKFLAYWKKEKFDVITGWNISGFDCIFLYNRIKKILSKKDADQLSHWNIVTSKVTEKNEKKYHSINYIGTVIIDYLDLYKKFMLEKRESYKLDSIASYELGENKLEYSEYESIQEFWEKNPEMFFHYNIQDTNLVVNLDNKLKLLDLTFLFSYTAKQNYFDVYSPVNTWESLCYNYLYDNNIVVPPRLSTGKKESFAGAYVKESIPGLFRDIVSFDVASLYPSCIRFLNISPETIVQKIIDPEIQNKNLVDLLLDGKLKNYTKNKDNNFTLSANGQFYRKDITGMIPDIMSILINKRKVANKEMTELKKELKLINEQLKEIVND